LFDIDTMPVARIDHPLIERVEGRIKVIARALVACVPVHARPI
jgi:hypothetical protein